MGQCQGRLVKSRRVQLIPGPQQMANNLQRQCMSATRWSNAGVTVPIICWLTES